MKKHLRLKKFKYIKQKILNDDIVCFKFDFVIADFRFVIDFSYFNNNFIFVIPIYGYWGNCDRREPIYLSSFEELKSFFIKHLYRDYTQYFPEEFFLIMMEEKMK